MKSFTTSTLDGFSGLHEPKTEGFVVGGNASTSVSTFVGGIPSRCTRDQLTQFMSQFGYVKEVYISKDNNNIDHKGFAFVKFDHVWNIESLFGTHYMGRRQVEVKRNLQDYLNLKHVPHYATELDISAVFWKMGYHVLQVLLGGKAGGVSPGVAGVRLSKFSDQEQVSKLRTIKILDSTVSIQLHIPKRKESGHESKSEQSPKSSPTEPCSISTITFSSDHITNSIRENSSYSKQPAKETKLPRPQSEEYDDSQSSGQNDENWPKDLIRSAKTSSSSRGSRNSADVVAAGAPNPKNTDRISQFGDGGAGNLVEVLKQPTHCIGLSRGTATDARRWEEPNPQIETPRREQFVTFYAFPGHL